MTFAKHLNTKIYTYYNIMSTNTQNMQHIYYTI